MNEDEVLTRWWDAREAGHTWRKMVGWRPPRVKWLHAAHANKAINWALQRWKAWRIRTTMHLWRRLWREDLPIIEMGIVDLTSFRICC